MTDRTEDPAEFTEALGVYIGEASRDDVVIMVESMPPTSELIARIEDRHGVVAWAHGLPLLLSIAEDDGAEYDDFDERPDVVVICGPRGTEALGFGYMVRDAPLVLELGHGEYRDAERYSGGVRLKGAFGQTITIVVWHSLLHVTEDGDVAPGIAATFEIEEKGDDQ